MRWKRLKRNAKKKKEMTHGSPVGVCCHCGKAILRKALTLDHVVPKSQGGTYEDDNVELSCKECNEERGNQDFKSFQRRKRYQISIGHRRMADTS